MNHCNTCRFFQKDGSYATPPPPDMREKNCWRTGPHCTYNPKWVEVSDPEFHYCAHWNEHESEWAGGPK